MAKAAINFVMKLLARELKSINKKELKTKVKIRLFVQSHLAFVAKHPEMIEYFFKIYLINKEIFEEEDKSGFELAQSFINEVEILIKDGVDGGEFRAGNFYIVYFLQ